MFAKRPVWARAGTAFEGKRYGTASSWYGDGEVFSYDENRVVCKFRNEPTPSHMMYGLIQLPAFVVFKQDSSEELRFRRTRRFPRQVFEIWVTGNHVGEVVQLNSINRCYELNLASGINWSLSLPLFTAGFFGFSSDGGRLLFWLKSHRVWQVVVDRQHDSTLLTACIAFVHREYLRHQ